MFHLLDYVSTCLVYLHLAMLIHTVVWHVNRIHIRIIPIHIRTPMAVAVEVMAILMEVVLAVAILILIAILIRHHHQIHQ